MKICSGKVSFLGLSQLGHHSTKGSSLLTPLTYLLWDWQRTSMQERTVPTCIVPTSSIQAYLSQRLKQRLKAPKVVPNPRRPKPEEVSLLRERFSGIASMRADAKALRNATGLVHGWTDAAMPRMARSGGHAEKPRGFAF